MCTGQATCGADRALAPLNTANPCRIAQDSCGVSNSYDLDMRGAPKLDLNTEFCECERLTLTNKNPGFRALSKGSPGVDARQSLCTLCLYSYHI